MILPLAGVVVFARLPARQDEAAHGRGIRAPALEQVPEVQGAVLILVGPCPAPSPHRHQGHPLGPRPSDDGGGRGGVDKGSAKDPVRARGRGHARGPGPGGLGDHPAPQVLRSELKGGVTVVESLGPFAVDLAHAKVRLAPLPEIQRLMDLGHHDDSLRTAGERHRG